MKTIKGPALFLAQFAADEAPFDSLDAIAVWAAGLGFTGVQMPSWDGRLFDLAKAAESTGYCDEVKGVLVGHGLDLSERRPTCRASWSPCIRPTTRPSTASPRPRCAATRWPARPGWSTR